MLVYRDQLAEVNQSVFPLVNFKFFLLDPQGRYIVNIVEITKTTEQLLSENIFKWKPYRLQNGEVGFKLGVSNLSKFLAEGVVIKKV